MSPHPTVNKRSITRAFPPPEKSPPSRYTNLLLNCNGVQAGRMATKGKQEPMTGRTLGELLHVDS